MWQNNNLFDMFMIELVISLRLTIISTIMNHTVVWKWNVKTVSKKMISTDHKIKCLVWKLNNVFYQNISFIILLLSFKSWILIDN